MRKPNPSSFINERSVANEKWEKLLNDKWKGIQLAMSASNSTIKPHKLLILADLQGVYLALHKWISEHNVPIDDGLIIGRFARLQIERTAKEVAIRLVNSQPRPAGDLRQLFESVEISYVGDRAYLGKGLDVLKEGTYLDISMMFEMFYAPVPLNEIEWELMKSARHSAEAKDQLKKVKSGVVTRTGIFERDYKVYDDFVSYLKESTYHSCSHEGFFGYYVGPHGLKNFDEKEVDIRIAIRAMDALHNREADSICIVSSDQDFMPLHKRADDFGVPSFQADLAKFMESDKVGKKFKSLGERFIRGGIDPIWPLEVLTEAISKPDIGHFATLSLGEQELHALCHLHNELNEVKIALDVNSDGKASIRLHRPC
jgi:uncharacterized LabA/DUF88 family protein